MPAFRWLISLFLSWLLCHIPVAAGEDSIDPGLDSTLNHVKYDSIISLSYNPRAAAEKARLLDSIAKSPTATGVFVDFGHPRYNLLYAMYGFWRHGERYEAEAKRSKENYDEVDEHHKEIIRKATDYDQIYDTVIPLHLINGEIAREIVKFGQKYYQVDDEELMKFISMHEYNNRWDDQERVVEALQHIFRDWTLEGTHERAEVVETIIKTIDQAFPDRDKRKEGPVRILLPGSGLGRLAHEVANLPDLEVTANELSLYMRLAYRYIESLAIPNARASHPFLDWWSHQPNRAELFHKTEFPDVAVNASKLLLVEGDFNKVFVNDTAHFDAVFTFFFMDTATNMLHYFDTMSNILKPGAIWINMGPLLYHKASVELSLDDMMAIAEEYGFEFMDVDEEWGPLTLKNRKSRQRMVSYLCHDGSMRINAYKVQFFMATYNPKKTKGETSVRDEL